jgi:hypothetical protein
LLLVVPLPFLSFFYASPLLWESLDLGLGETNIDCIIITNIPADFSSITNALQTPLPPSPAPSPAPSIISTARGRVRDRFNLLRRNPASVLVSAEEERRAREEEERREERLRKERKEREECWGRDL